MDIAVYMTAEKLLYAQAVKCLQEARSSVTEATSLLAPLVADDSDLLDAICAHYLQTVLDRDMNGGGIGLRPVTKTGGDAVADDAGQRSSDTQARNAPSSAPRSQTPAPKPVRGGQSAFDTHARSASPSIPSRNEAYTVVREHERVLPSKKVFAAQQEQWRPADIAPAAKPVSKPIYVAPKPRTSAESRLRVKNSVAMSILDNFMLRRRPIGDWTYEELSKVAEETGREHRIATAFMAVTPAGSHVRDYVKPEAAKAIIQSLGLEVDSAA